jgi:hypothetical protein
VRVFLPSCVADIQGLLSQAELPRRVGYAANPQWALNQDDQDPEYLEQVLLYTAAAQSLESNPENTGRIVIVVEMPVTEIDTQAGLVEVAEFSQKQIQALFADDLANKTALLAGQDVTELDLTWFGPSEILEFRDFIAS